MPLTTLLTDRLTHEFPQFKFVAGPAFRWSPPEQTIFFDQSFPDQPALLHELAHAILGHRNYKRDIELLEMERDAWQYAAQLGESYHIIINEETVQAALDSYRDWLHARSVCPDCNATGIQTTKTTYHCIACHGNWQVNEARTCALRRHKLK